MINSMAIFALMTALTASAGSSSGTGFTPSSGLDGFEVVSTEIWNQDGTLRAHLGSEGREVDVRNLSNYRHLLVNVRNGAEVGLCHDVENGGIRSIHTRQDADAEWSAIGNFSSAECEPGENNTIINEDDIYRAAVRLLVHPGGPQLQPPPGSNAYVNAPTIVFVDPAPQEVQATVNGITVHIRATPIIFEWDFGDGSDPITTRDPGSPYPHHTVFYEYPRAGNYTISLTTAWQGQWSIDNNTWQNFPTHVITGSDAGDLNVLSVRARLVTGPSS